MAASGLKYDAASARINAMANEIEEMRSKIRSEADRIASERAARQRRYEVLQIAGHIVGGIVANPARYDADIAVIAAGVVELAEHVVDAVDRAGSPIIQPLPEGV